MPKFYHFMVSLVFVAGSSGCIRHKDAPLDSQAAMEARLAEEEIRHSFQGFMDAVFAARGRQALTMLDRESMSWYGRVVGLALTGTPEVVRALPLVEEVTVLSLRIEPGADTLRMLTAEQAFVYSVDKNWEGKGRAVKLEIGKIKVKGTQARGELVVEGQPTGQEILFTWDETWKLNYPSFVGLSREPWETMGKELKLRDDDLVLYLLNQTSKSTVTDAIYNPPGLGL